MRLAAPLAIVVLALALLAGCGDEGSGGGSSSQAVPAAPGKSAPAGATAKDCEGGAGAKVKLRVTGISCAAGLALTEEWQRQQGCAPAGEASRSACKLGGGYRCLGVVTDRGVSVSCARPDSSVAFTEKRG